MKTKINKEMMVKNKENFHQTLYKTFHTPIGRNKKATSINIMIIIFLLVNLLMANKGYSTVSVTAATGGNNIPADKAINGTNTFTALSNIVISEGSNNDFSTSGSLVINAPEGWNFKTDGVTVSVQGDATNITLGSVSTSSTSITIPITVHKQNKLNTIQISGIQVKATDGGNAPITGNITATGTLPIGLFPTTNLGTLTQTVGALAKIVITPLGETFNDLSTFSGSGNTGIPSNQKAGTAFSIALRATDQFFNVITTYVGNASISTTGNLSAGSGNTNNFSAGYLAAHNVTFRKGGNFTLSATSGDISTTSSIIPVYSQWIGNTSDWNIASNWPDNSVPDVTTNVLIPSSVTQPIISATAICNNIIINFGASLIINPQGYLTVSGNLTNNADATGLSLLSDATGTGSLIVKNATTAQATVKRYMTSGAWHLVSAPVTGQSIGSFLSGNTAIPTPVGATDPRAMRAYDPDGNQWGEFFSSTNANQIITGTGYCMRVKASAANHEVVFTGALQAGDIPVNGLSEGKWNCIGNPYTSAIGITNSASSTDNFLIVNALTNANIDPTSGIYIWDNPDEVNGQPGKYTTISNASNLKGLHYLQQGQGFMVKMASGKTSVSFTKAMQVHDPSLSLKSTENIWPTITLIASADSVNSSTVIAFHEGMTNGLDVTFDAGLLKSGGPMELYTRLVDDYGIPFAIQALPSDQYDQLIIPVGVDYSKGGKVSFSAQGFYLPTSCRPILEDRLTGLFTDLTDKTYTADLTSNTAGTGRFFLHTSYATTGTDSRKAAQKLSAWALGRQEININGKVNNGAVASLYDIQGRLIATHAMREGIRHRFSLPFLQPGLYLLKVRDGQQQQALKVVIGQ